MVTLRAYVFNVILGRIYYSSCTVYTHTHIRTHIQVPLEF